MQKEGSILKILPSAPDLIVLATNTVNNGGYIFHFQTGFPQYFVYIHPKLTSIPIIVISSKFLKFLIVTASNFIFSTSWDVLWIYRLYHILLLLQRNRISYWNEIRFFLSNILWLLLNVSCLILVPVILPWLQPSSWHPV